MTQKEKARAYDEAIERAKKWYNEEEPDSYTCIVESIFPELKESEDERIRKAMLKMVQETPNNLVWADYGLRKKEAIAWLEKQGEQNPDPRYSILDKLIEADDVYQMAMNDAMVEEARDKAMEALSKLEVSKLLWNLADKAEPKFKLGDWVVLSTSDGEKVVQINSIEYFKSGGPRYITSEDKWFGNGTKAHLWTIKDAKAGDVLANDHHILILRGLGCSWAANGNPDSLYAYCGIKPNGNFELEQKGYCFCGTLHTHPATKEQCDTLMKAMADAGYTFDFDKKELRKIL